MRLLWSAGNLRSIFPSSSLDAIDCMMHGPSPRFSRERARKMGKTFLKIEIGCANDNDVGGGDVVVRASDAVRCLMCDLC